MSVSQIDNHGIFTMSFDQIVIYPSYLNNYESPEIQVRYLQNIEKVSPIFELDFTPSQATINYLLENEIQLTYYWYVVDATPNEIKIHMKFNHPEAIAYSRMQSDLLGI